MARCVPQDPEKLGPCLPWLSAHSWISSALQIPQLHHPIHFLALSWELCFTIGSSASPSFLACPHPPERLSPPQPQEKPLFDFSSTCPSPAFSPHPLPPQTHAHFRAEKLQ